VPGPAPRGMWGGAFFLCNRSGIWGRAATDLRLLIGGSRLLVSQPTSPVVDRDIGIVPQPGGDSNSWPEIGYKNAAKTAFIAVSAAVREASISVFFIRGGGCLRQPDGRQATARPIYETLPPLSLFPNLGSRARLTGPVHGDGFFTRRVDRPAAALRLATPRRVPKTGDAAVEPYATRSSIDFMRNGVLRTSA
jgi:hypothetical protein